MKKLAPLPSIIFMSRWLQAPLYLGLIIAQGIYLFHFFLEMWHLFIDSYHFSEVQIMLAVLGLIDIVLISNLLIMVIVGGYETFVSRLGIENHPDRPEWLEYVGSGTLKIKLAMALISISSIHLLQSFIDAQNQTDHTLMWKVFIHLALIVSALTVATIDKMTHIDKK